MGNTRQEVRALAKKATVPFSTTMHWSGQRICSETPASRQGVQLKDIYIYRGRFNPLARKLAATIDEAQVERDIRAEEQSLRLSRKAVA